MVQQRRLQESFESSRGLLEEVSESILNEGEKIPLRRPSIEEDNLRVSIEDSLGEPSKISNYLPPIEEVEPIRMKKLFFRGSSEMHSLR